MILHYSCPGCGAEMTYDIKKQKLACNHCGRELESVMSADWENADVNEENGQTAAAFNNKEYQCPNCGGTLAVKDKETSTVCAYCGSPMIISERLQGERHPAKILPFRIDRSEAEAAFRKWCKNGLFAPAGFVSAKNIQRMKGLYVPYWLFHYNTRVNISAKATRVHVSRQGDSEVTQTEFFDVQRAYDLEYKDIPYDASEQLDDGEMAKLEPFNFDDLKSFNMPYLAGFDSSSYDFGDKDLSGTVKQKIEGYIHDFARGSVSGYSTVVVDNTAIEFTREDEEFIFVPIWFVDYNYRGEIYKFMMNGQNGRVAGKPPVSSKKVGLWWAGISAVLFLISFGITLLV